MSSSNEEGWDQIEHNIESMKAAPVVLNALLKYLMDKNIITKEELLDYIRRNLTKEELLDYIKRNQKTNNE
jgi:hypothetical protein